MVTPTMEKKHLEHFGAIGDALHNLWDAAETQYQMALEQQQAAQAAINGVAAATKALNDTARTLKGQLVDELHNAMDGAAEQAAQLLTAKFKEANQQADRAAATYKSAASWTTFKVFGFTTVIGGLVICAGVFMLTRSIPNYEEIKALRAEKAQLTSTIAALEKRGGRAVIDNCQKPDGTIHVCARVIGFTGEEWLLPIAGR